MYTAAFKVAQKTDVLPNANGEIITTLARIKTTRYVYTGQQYIQLLTFSKVQLNRVYNACRGRRSEHEWSRGTQQGTSNGKLIMRCISVGNCNPPNRPDINGDFCEALQVSSCE